MAHYFPVLVFAVLAAALPLGTIIVARAVQRRRPNPAKLEPYECGIEPSTSAFDTRFSVRYFLIAVLFVVFDVETIFLFPWAVAFRSLGLFGLAEMSVFIALVFVAYVYIWRKGGFDWSVGEITPNEAEDVVERERALSARSERRVASPDVNERQGAGRAG